MPKFTTHRGMSPGKMIMEFNDKLHILGRVYRTSDLSEIVGKTAMPPHHYSSANNASPIWKLRLKRGFQPGTRLYGNVAAPHMQLCDFDAALCGNWAGVTSAGLFLDATKFRQFTNNYAGNLAIDADTETGAISNSENVNIYTTGNTNDCGVFLPAGAGGTLAVYRQLNASGGASALESYPAGSPASTQTNPLLGAHVPGTGTLIFQYRVSDHPLRWYFVSTYAASTAGYAALQVHGVMKSTLAMTALSSGLALPAGATPIGTGGLGYANSVPSYAYNSGVNELSSYILWRTATNMEIHRVQISGTDAAPVVTNNLVTLDQNPMTVHGSATVPTSARIQLISHTDGNKYLMVFGMEIYGANPNNAVSMVYVYKLTDKNTGQFVGSYQFASQPRSHLASDDSGLRFIMAYDDRYEFWAFGAGGVLSKVDTVYNQRANAAQYYEGESYGFDSTGRFWYVTADSQKPANVAEVGLNFYSPPGQVNTISITFDNDNYTYSGAPVNGNLSVSVKDITGAYIATTVNLSPSVNISLQSSQVNTTTAGPTLVPFTINAPGDLSVDAWT